MLKSINGRLIEINPTYNMEACLSKAFTDSTTTTKKIYNFIFCSIHLIYYITKADPVDLKYFRKFILENIIIYANKYIYA